MAGAVSRMCTIRSRQLPHTALHSSHRAFDVSGTLLQLGTLSWGALAVSWKGHLLRMTTSTSKRCLQYRDTANECHQGGSAQPVADDYCRDTCKISGKQGLTLLSITKP